MSVAEVPAAIPPRERASPAPQDPAPTIGRTGLGMGLQIGCGIRCGARTFGSRDGRVTGVTFEAIVDTISTGGRVETIKELWRGEISLPRTFWLWGNLELVLEVGGTAIIEALAKAMGFQFLVTVWSSFVCLGGMFMNVAIWRSAGNYQGPRVWAILARIIAGIGLLWQVVQFFVGE